MLLEDLLEKEKRKRAEEIARKRAAGYEMPVDHLTTEAMIAQAAAQLEKARRAAEELRVADGSPKVGLRDRRKADEESVLNQLKMHPTISAEAMAEALGISLSGVYNHLKTLKSRGVIARPGRNEPWEISNLGK